MNRLKGTLAVSVEISAAAEKQLGAEKHPGPTVASISFSEDGAAECRFHDTGFLVNNCRSWVQRTAFTLTTIDRFIHEMADICGNRYSITLLLWWDKKNRFWWLSKVTYYFSLAGAKIAAKKLGEPVVDINNGNKIPFHGKRK